MSGGKSKSDRRGVEIFPDDMMNFLAIHMINLLIGSYMPVGIRFKVLVPTGFFTFFLQKHDS